MNRASFVHGVVYRITAAVVLGGHSLLAVRMMAQIQQRVGQSIPLVTLLQAPTIEQFAAHLRDQALAAAWSPLIPLQQEGRQHPLFLVHPIGGMVFCYAELAQLLGPNQPVYGLQAPGLEAGQTPHRSITMLAAAYVAAIRSIQPDGPYRLGGWSFGGVVAFELARQLQQQGEIIDLLVLIDSGAPTPEGVLPDDTTLLCAFLQDFGGMLDMSIEITRADLEPLTVDEQMAYVVTLAQQVLPEGMDLEHLRRLVQVFSANLSMLAAYRPAPSPLPVAFLMAEATERGCDLTEAWRAFTTVVACQVVPGTHYTLLRSPQVQAVADFLNAQLAQHR